MKASRSPPGKQHPRQPGAAGRLEVGGLVANHQGPRRVEVEFGERPEDHAGIWASCRGGRDGRIPRPRPRGEGADVDRVEPGPLRREIGPHPFVQPLHRRQVEVSAGDARLVGDHRRGYARLVQPANRAPRAGNPLEALDRPDIAVIDIQHGRRGRRSPPPVWIWSLRSWHPGYCSASRRPTPVGTPRQRSGPRLIRPSPPSAPSKPRSRDFGRWSGRSRRPSRRPCATPSTPYRPGQGAGGGDGEWGKSGHVARKIAATPGLHRHAGLLPASGRSQPRRPRDDPPPATWPWRSRGRVRRRSCGR